MTLVPGEKLACSLCSTTRRLLQDVTYKIFRGSSCEGLLLANGDNWRSCRPRRIYQNTCAHEIVSHAHAQRLVQQRYNFVRRRIYVSVGDSLDSFRICAARDAMRIYRQNNSTITLNAAYIQRRCVP